MAGKVGRPPKPAHLRLLQGNPGKTPIKDDMPEPELLTSAVPPEYLSKVAKAKWVETVPMLARNNVFSEMDVPLLALYCEAFADWMDCRKQFELNGKVSTAESGYQSVSPYVTIERQCHKVMMDCMSIFGMGPSHRTRISVDATTPHGKKATKGGLLD